MYVNVDSSGNNSYDNRCYEEIKPEQSLSKSAVGKDLVIKDQKAKKPKAKKALIVLAAAVVLVAMVAGFSCGLAALAKPSIDTDWMSNRLESLEKATLNIIVNETQKLYSELNIVLQENLEHAAARLNAIENQTEHATARLNAIENQMQNIERVVYDNANSERLQLHTLQISLEEQSSNESITLQNQIQDIGGAISDHVQCKPTVCYPAKPNQGSY